MQLVIGFDSQKLLENLRQRPLIWQEFSGQIFTQIFCSFLRILMGRYSRGWNTGHPGNICTLHASSAADALHRLNRLSQQEQPGFDFREEIERMVGCVVFIAGEGSSGNKREIKLLTDGSRKAT